MNFKSICIFLISASLFLTGCSTVTYTYTNEYARVKNLCGSGWLTEGNLAVTVQNGCTYRFEPDISETERAEYISRHREILELLPAYMLSGEELDLYILQNIESHADGKKTAYIDISLQKCTEQILMTLCAVCGEYTNYGYLYALAADMAAALGWAEMSGTAPVPVMTVGTVKYWLCITNRT